MGWKPSWEWIKEIKLLRIYKNEVKEFEVVTKENDKNSEILSSFFEWGIIDGEGRLIDLKEKQEDYKNTKIWILTK